MASLLSSWSSNLKSLPENYAVPEGKRPGKLAPISRDIPVIDLGEADRAAVVQKIIKASQEFGLFQVHGHIRHVCVCVSMCVCIVYTYLQNDVFRS